MSNVPINMTIDRHRTGNARIHGKVGNTHHDVNVWKGPQVGDAYIEGRQNGETTTLRINSAFSDNGHSVFGRVAGVPFKGNWEQEPVEGDAQLSLNKAQLSVDQDPSTGATAALGTRIKADSQVTSAEGDETLTLLADGQRISLTVDRQADGDIDVRGRSGGGAFRFTMERRGQDGDLHIKGKIPESLSLLPVMWELYGDDSIEPPAKPLTLGTAAAVSAFWGFNLAQ